MSTLEANWTTPQLRWRDPQIAAGHQVVVVSTNTLIAFYTKKGDLLPAWLPIPGKPPPPKWTNPITAAQLFAPLASSLAANLNLPAGVDPAIFGFDAFYDTRVIFDRHRNRFWIGALAINNNTRMESLGLTPKQRGSRRTKFLLAVSVDEDPRHGWHLYWWDATKDDGAYNYGEDSTGFIFVPGDAGDYPYIGVDAKFLAQTNVVGHRDPATGKKTSRRYAFANIVDANALAAGGLPPKLEIGKTVPGSVYAPIYDPYGREFRSAVQPAQHLTNDAWAQLFLVGVLNDPKQTPHKTEVVIWTRPWASATLKTRTVPVQPSNDWVAAPQGGDSTVPSPAPLKFRNLNAFSVTYSKGFIHFAFGDSMQSTNGLVEAMRVLRIPAFETTVAGLTNAAKGFIDRRLPAAKDVWHYGWPALTANADGDMVLAYQRTSGSTFPEVRYNVWPKEAAGPEPSHRLQAGQMPFVDTPDPQDGTVGDIDMINIAADPDGKTVWIAHPYPFKPDGPDPAPSNYRLAVGRVRP
jgi:hypothetical protein